MFSRVLRPLAVPVASRSPWRAFRPERHEKKFYQEQLIEQRGKGKITAVPSQALFTQFVNAFEQKQKSSDDMSFSYHVSQFMSLCQLLGPKMGSFEISSLDNMLLKYQLLLWSERFAASHLSHVESIPTEGPKVFTQIGGLPVVKAFIREAINMRLHFIYQNFFSTGEPDLQEADFLHHMQEELNNVRDVLGLQNFLTKIDKKAKQDSHCTTFLEQDNLPLKLVLRFIIYGAFSSEIHEAIKLFCSSNHPLSQFKEIRGPIREQEFQKILNNFKSELLIAPEELAPVLPFIQEHMAGLKNESDFIKLLSAYLPKKFPGIEFKPWGYVRKELLSFNADLSYISKHGDSNQLKHEAWNHLLQAPLCGDPNLLNECALMRQSQINMLHQSSFLAPLASPRLQKIRNLYRTANPNLEQIKSELQHELKRCENPIAALKKLSNELNAFRKQYHLVEEPLNAKEAVQPSSERMTF